jgi:hypothetical protein
MTSWCPIPEVPTWWDEDSDTVITAAWITTAAIQIVERPMVLKEIASESLGWERVARSLGVQ